VTGDDFTGADPTGDDVVRLLAEPARLRIHAALVLGAGSPSDVAAVTGLAPRDVLAGLSKLADGGLVEWDGAVARPVAGLFRELARRAAPPPPAPITGYTDQVAAVLRAFVRDGRLTGLPAQRGKRLLVLDHVAQSFEPGTSYPEREVDDTLVAWTTGSGVDHVSLRRYLVDEHLLRRENGVYRRSGGSTDVSE
jgi:hypothetical protein